jgi:hypothetical protein
MRLSYSLLKAWKQGRREDCKDIYLHVDKPTNHHMDLGNEFDTFVTSYVALHKKLPDFLGAKAIENPLPKEKITVKYNDIFILSGEIDINDNNQTLYELKCSGAFDSADYLNDFQLHFYLLMMKLLGHEPKEIWLYRADAVKFKLWQNSGTVLPDFFDTSKVYNSEQARQKAEAMIMKEGLELYEYFLEEGIINE